MKTCCAILLAAIAAEFLPTRNVSAGPTYSVADLGTLGTLGGTQLVVGNGINASGQIVGSAQTTGSSTFPHAFLYDGTMHDLGTLGGAYSVANAINAGGQVTGVAQPHAFLYDGTMHDLGTLGGNSSTGTAINGQGQIVGYSEITGNAATDAFLYDGTMHDLGTLGGKGSYANGINGKGQIVGFSATTPNNEDHAFLYDGTMHDLGTLPGGNYSAARGINAGGQIVGTANNSGNAEHPFLYDGTMHDLGTLGGAVGFGEAINSSGEVVGEAETTGNAATDAFVYDSVLGMRDLNSLIDQLSGWTLEQANGVNDLGQITGYGIINGQTHAFLLTPVPQVPVLGIWTGTNGTNWADSGNWSGAVPGATTGTTNIDTALFNQNAPNSPLILAAGRNLQNITFDTASVNSLTIGTIGGNALLLTAGGTIQTTSTVVHPQTVNAPLVLEGNYTFTSDAISSSATLNFGGRITPTAASGITTLTLNGANTGTNTISGVLADNGLGILAVTKSGAGIWVLNSAKAYNGPTIVSAGTLRFNITSGTPTIAAGAIVTVARGATLELAGSVSALGAPNGNRAPIVNDSSATGILVSGTHQIVGSIDGSGTTQVNAGSDLRANHIIQNTLVVGGAAGSPGLVMIAASDSSGNPLGEPSTLALAGSLTPSNPFGAGASSANSIVDLANVGSSATASALGSSTAGAGLAAVPEPTSLVLLAIGGLATSALAIVRRRKSHAKSQP